MFRGKHSVTRHGCVFTLEKEGVVHESRPPDEAFAAPEVHFLTAPISAPIPAIGAGPARAFLHPFSAKRSPKSGHFHLQNGSGRNATLSSTVPTDSVISTTNEPPELTWNPGGTQVEPR